LGALLWQECWFAWLEDGILCWPEVSLERPERKQRRKAIQALLIPFFGHHGQPVEAQQLRLEQFFAKDADSNDQEAARQFVAEWASLIEVEWPIEQLVSDEWLQTFQALSWTIAGWVTLSDWLGSNQEHFRYCQKEMPLAEYWERYALP